MPGPQDLEIELLQQIRIGDRDAFAKMVQMYSAVLTKMAWIYVGDAQSAEDAVQETLLAAWDAARRKREDASLKAWLFGILANRCHKYLRTAGRRRKREQAAAKADAAPPEADRDDLRLQIVRDAMLRLEKEHREVVILRFWQDLSVEETAAALGIPAGTVKSRCHVAIGRLREMMRPT
jgi:RNA polymerase sigma-70 factor, ECF subfamily